MAFQVFEVQKVIKVRADHWEKRVTKATRDMMVKKVTWARKVNEDHKVFKALPVWKDPKDPKVSKVHEVKPDHQALRERKENWVFLVSLATLDHLARKETKAHQDGLARLATKETEYILNMTKHYFLLTSLWAYYLN